MVISSIWAFLLSFPCTTTSSKQPLYSAPRVVAYERVDCTVRYRYLYSFLALFVLLWLKWNSKVPYPAAKVLIVWNTLQMLCLIIKIEKSKGVTWWINFFFLFGQFNNFTSSLFWGVGFFSQYFLGFFCYIFCGLTKTRS